MFKAILFDMGDTLITGTRPIEEACELVGKERPNRAGTLERAAKYFQTLREQDLANLTQQTFRQALVLSVMTEEFDRSETDNSLCTTLEEFDELVDAVFDKTIENTELMPGIKGVLGVLRDDNYDLGIVSNVSFEGVRYRKLLTSFGIASLFDVMVYSSDVGFRKPHSLPFEKALTALNAPPFDSLHVGDLYHTDVIGAQTLGIEAVLLDRPGTYVHGDAILPDWVIRDVREVLSIVENA